MIGDWKALLVEKRAEWNLPAGEWSYMVYNNYHPHYSNLNIFWFHNDANFPRIVTKVFREPELPQREFANMTRANALAPRHVPKPLYLSEDDGLWLLWMKGVPGWPFNSRDGHSPARLRSVIEMICAIHQPASQGTVADRHARMVAAPLERLAAFGATQPVQSFCAGLMDRASEQWLSKLRVIPQHGDLAMGNVLHDGSLCYAVDWESFGAIDLPYYDLLTFLLSILNQDGGSAEKWDRSIVQHLPSVLRWYAERVQTPVSEIAVLLPLTLVNWFYLHWKDGRSGFTERMYQVIRRYCENPAPWHKALTGAGHLA